MEYISEKARETPIVQESDICVIGGSCTGVFAAVRAARMGCDVSIIENNGCFGGVATAGLVPIWHSNYDMARQERIVAGLSIELIDRLKKRNAVTEESVHSASRAFVFNSEEMKIELDKLILENEVRPFLHTRFVEPILSDDGVLTAVVIEDKNGRRAVKAKYFIDATGDGDLAVRMGLANYKPEAMQPATSVFIFDNFMEMVRQNPKFNLSAELFNSKHSQALREGFLWGSHVPGRDNSYMIAGTRAHGADCSDADQLTQAEITCRSQIRDICDILRDNSPGGDALALANIASYIGIRETNHIVCQHTITEEELLNGVEFEDAIGFGTYRVDIHHADKAGITVKNLDGTQIYMEPGKKSIGSRWRPESEGTTPYYQIPYRSLVPKGDHGNILVAGRLMGADQGAYGAIRVMMNCNQTGEAAGVASAIALKDGLNVEDVAPALLQETMINGGSLIPRQP